MVFPVAGFEVPLMVFVPLLPGWIQALVILRRGRRARWLFIPVSIGYIKMGGGRVEVELYTFPSLRSRAWRRWDR